MTKFGIFSPDTIPCPPPAFLLPHRAHFTTPDCRLERHAPVSVEMCVLPSLSVAASVLPSYARRGEYVLSLEATNYRSNGDDVWDNRHFRIHKVRYRVLSRSRQFGGRGGCTSCAVASLFVSDRSPVVVILFALCLCALSSGVVR